jgi:hypothetical protein
MRSRSDFAGKELSHIRESRPLKNPYLTPIIKIEADFRPVIDRYNGAETYDL